MLKDVKLADVSYTPYATLHAVKGAGVSPMYYTTVDVRKVADEYVLYS